MPETLYLQLFYESPASRLTVARVEQHPIFHNVARIALDQAERRGDETERLERLLEAILPGFRE